MLSLLAGFLASETKFPISLMLTSDLVLSKCVPIALSAFPYWRRVMTAVTGIALTGKIGLPIKPLMNKLLPASNCPKIAISISLISEHFLNFTEDILGYILDGVMGYTSYDLYPWHL
jgi:uncharacterized membrane protein AbrB (regulator of aidB expression)